NYVGSDRDRKGGVGSMVRFRWLFGVIACLCAVAAAARMPSTRQPAAPPEAGTYPSDGIAAVVDDQVISVGDLGARIKMVMLSTNIGDSPESRARIANQVLRAMIDEKLELEEAKRQNVSATDTEVDKAIATIAKQNNLTAAQLDDVLKSHGVERSALTDQLK